MAACFREGLGSDYYTDWMNAFCVEDADMMSGRWTG